MTKKHQALAVFGAAALAVGSSSAIAQDTAVDPTTSVAVPTDDDDGDEGKWGLLGLLGLAGLLGLKRRDDVHRGTTNTTNTTNRS